MLDLAYERKLTENNYYRVTKPFDVWILKGHKDSNAYYGSAMILEPQYKKSQAQIGDEIHNLCGGIFIVKGELSLGPVIGEPFKFRPFEKTYGRKNQNFPKDCIVRISDPTTIVGKYGVN